MKELFRYIFKLDIKNLFMEATTNVFIQFFRYVFVGGAAFLVDGGALFLIEMSGVHYLVAVVFAFVIGLITNFVLSRLLVFKGNETEKSSIVEFVVYAVIGIIGLGITEVIMYICTEKAGLYFMVSKVIAAVIVLVWNFVARKITLYKGN